jgi:hypothetical protein
MSKKNPNDAIDRPVTTKNTKKFLGYMNWLKLSFC